MAISWIVALKAVPWSDLVQAAPHIVKGARKLFTTVRNRAGGDSEPDSAQAAGTLGDTPEELRARLVGLERAFESLHAEQQASAELIRSLAEQNARVVEAIGIIRARARLAMVLCTALILILGGVVIWLLAR